MELTVYVNCEDLKKVVDMFDVQGLPPRYAVIDFSYEQGDSYNYYDVGLSVELGDLLKDNKLQINNHRYINRKKERINIDSIAIKKCDCIGNCDLDTAMDKLGKGLEDAVNNSKGMG